MSSLYAGHPDAKKVFPFLAPAICGMPSRRHLIVARRAKAHMNECNESVRDIPIRNWGDCKKELVFNLLARVDRAIWEMEHALGNAAAAEITRDLQEIKKARAAWPLPSMDLR